MHSVNFWTFVLFVGFLAPCLWEVGKIFVMEKKSKERIARWQRLSEKAQRGDLAAFQELLDSGPGKKNYK